MYGPFSSVSGYLDPEYSTLTQDSESESSRPAEDSPSPDLSTSTPQESSGVPYGTETTRKLWSRINHEGRSATSPNEIRLSYSQSYDYVNGTL